MIFGVGTDLVVIERVRAMLDRHGVRMARRILALAELAEFEVAHDPARFLAKRFAAKEALAKAAGTGMRAPLHLSAIGVRHNGLGRPELFFSDELAAWLGERGVVRSHLSLSDEQGHALAFVVLEAE